MPENVQRIVDLTIELWNTGNPEVVRRLYSENAERRDPNEEQPARGAQNIARYVAEVRTGFPDFKLEITHRVAEGNYLATEWTVTGTHKGTFQGIPATGKRIEISGSAMVRIGNGKIADEHIYFDRVALLEQLGVAPGVMQSGAKHATG